MMAFLPHWGWQTWVILSLLALSGVIFEASFRLTRSAMEERDEALEAPDPLRVRFEIHG
jgi:hypothetical protein